MIKCGKNKHIQIDHTCHEMMEMKTVDIFQRKEFNAYNFLTLKSRVFVLL